MTVLEWKLCTDELEKYQAYLCSEEWWSIRRRVMDRANDTCERCKRAPADNVHHLTYIRKYREELCDLLAVCKPCHDRIHAIRADQVQEFKSETLGMDSDTIKLFLLISAKRAASECITAIRTGYPELVVDEWLIKYAERRAFELDCEKYGIEELKL